MPGKIIEALQSLEDVKSMAKNRSRWRIVPACIQWTNRKERISRYFEKTENSTYQIKLNCVLLLCFWCKQMYSDDTDSIIDVLESI